MVVEIRRLTLKVRDLVKPYLSSDGYAIADSLIDEAGEYTLALELFLAETPNVKKVIGDEVVAEILKTIEPTDYAGEDIINLLAA